MINSGNLDESFGIGATPPKASWASLIIPASDTIFMALTTDEISTALRFVALVVLINAFFCRDWNDYLFDDFFWL